MNNECRYVYKLFLLKCCGNGSKHGYLLPAIISLLALPRLWSDRSCLITSSMISDPMKEKSPGTQECWPSLLTPLTIFKHRMLFTVIIKLCWIPQTLPTPCTLLDIFLPGFVPYECCCLLIHTIKFVYHFN